MLTQNSYESKHISDELSPLFTYYRPGGVSHSLQWPPLYMNQLTSFCPSGFVHIGGPDDVPDFAVDEDQLCFDFGLVAAGEDFDGVTLFEPLGCVYSAQRVYEPWPDFGWGTHAAQQRYRPDGPWIKVVSRRTLRLLKRQRRRRVRKTEVLEKKALSRGCEIPTTKPGSHYRSGNKHHKDEERRLRPRKKVDRKRHRRLFDSTLGYPGEGPGPVRRGRWRPLPAPDCHFCRLGKGCPISGHWHQIVREAKSGAARRLLEKKQQEQKLERGKSKQKYFKCSVEFSVDCKYNEHFHDGKQLATEHIPEVKEAGDLWLEDFDRRLAGLELPRLEEAPDGPAEWVDREPEDYAPTRVHEPHIVFRERDHKTFDDPPCVEAAFGGVDHKHMVQSVNPAIGRKINYCDLCAEVGLACDTPCDDMNMYTYAACPDCLHHWQSHRTGGHEIKHPIAAAIVDDPVVPPRIVEDVAAPVIVGEVWVDDVGVAPVRRRRKVPVMVENCGLRKPKRRDLWPTVDSLQVFEDAVKKFDASKLNLEYVVEILNHNHVETRVLYQAGEANEIACCNPCFSFFSLMPCTVVDDVVLVNEWQAMLVSEIQEVEATNMPAIRFRGFAKMFAKRRLVPGVNNFVKFFTHATRSPIYTNLLHALMRRKEITACTLLRGDGSTVTYVSSLAYYVAGRLVRADGFRYFEDWANNSSILLNTIIALLNQLYIRDVRLALAVPNNMSTRPAFPRTGLYTRYRDAMAPIVSQHRSVW